MKVSLEQAQTLSGESGYAAYACLDTTGTLEVFNVLNSRLSPSQARTYRWSMAQLSPATTMTLRGIRVDVFAREKAAKEMERLIVLAEKDVAGQPLVRERWDGKQLDRGSCREAKARSNGKPGKHLWPRDKKTGGNNKRLLKGAEPTPVTVVPAPPVSEQTCKRCGTKREIPKPFEATSPKQVQHLLYDILKVPTRRGKKGEITSDDEALQSIAKAGRAMAWTHDGKKQILKRLQGLPELCEAILNMRDLQKQLGFLRAKLSDRGRFHASFNVMGAWTGRWSSSKDPFKRGGNMQNVGEQHRHIFLADHGRKIGYADLKTAESLQVAYLAGDEAYIEAHKGDVHTWVCRELWPQLPWTGDIKADKSVASSNYPDWDNVPGHDYRFQSKRIQHGTNFGLSAFGISIIAKIPLEAAQMAQARYFRAFPMIQEYQRWVTGRVKGQYPLVNALGREAILFGRPWDDHTRKQGLAFSPQGGVGDVLNTGLWRVWHKHDPERIELLAQVHDAILFQCPASRVEEAVRALSECMRVDVLITDFTGITRTCTIPVEIAVGDNWGKFNDKPFDKQGKPLRINLGGIKEVK